MAWIVMSAPLHGLQPATFPSTGKLRPWPLAGAASVVPETMSANVVDPLIHLAIAGHGIACLPPFTIRQEILDGRLVPLLEQHVHEVDQFNIVWPASRQVTARLRAFIDFMTSRLTPASPSNRG